MYKTTLQIGIEVEELEGLFYLLAQAIERLEDLKGVSPENSLELGAIKELIRDARGPINAKLNALYRFNKY